MEMSSFGNTDLMVSRLGTGLAEMGYELTLDDVAEAGRVLNAALDGGINFLDTAASYDVSEELIGRTIAHRRDEYILATKCGGVTGGYEGVPWTAQTIRDSVDRSLARMKTDHLDLLQLHSCSLEVLEQGEAIEALLEAKRAGKTRYVGYSGDNEAAAWSIESGHFDALQTSFSVVDQRARTRLFGPAKAKGMGIIVKRPIANGAWGVDRSSSTWLVHNPVSTYADEYFRRAQIMEQMGPIPGAPDDRILLTIGFVLAHVEVDTAILGTRNPSHAAANIDMVENQLPISTEAIEEMYRRFDEVGGEWEQRG